MALALALPPGRTAIPVAGIEADLNPKLAQTAGELNAWIDYLLHPDTNDGPRVYRPLHPETGPDDEDFESPHRMPPADRDAPYEDPREYQTLSVFHDLGDTGEFFKAAQAVSGFRTEIIEATFDKLTKGCLTYENPNDVQAGNGKVDDPPPTRYPEMHPARVNWVEMRKTWESPESVYATKYERDFLAYQLITENCLYVVAEHVVRYRAIVHKAGEDIEALMRAMVDMCPKPAPPGQGTFNLMSVLVTGIVALGTTVITAGAGGVTVGVALSVLLAEMLGEGIKTAERKPPENKLLLENKYYLADVARQYIQGVDKIERDASDGIKALFDSLRRELDGLRQLRSHQPKREGTSNTEVPFFRDYLYR
jgi:hypothetical protein